MITNILIRRRRGSVAACLALALLAGAGGCGDSTGIDADDVPGLASLVVSDPFVPAVPAGQVALLASPVAYVSFPPGTIPNGVSATISNPRTGAALTVALFGGGLDPIPIAADAADTLRFSIDTGGVDRLRFFRLVPEFQALTVVRTEPPAGKRDVPLNLRARIVFSEPLDPTTVTGTSVRLIQGGSAVPGSVSVSGDGLEATFQPAAALLPGTEYILEVGAEVRDGDGSGLDAPVTAGFTTGTGSGTPVALRFERQPVSTFVNVANPTRIRVSATDALGNPATGFTGTVTVAIGANPGGGSLGGVTTRTGGPYVEFDDLRIDRPGSGYTLIAAADGFSGATSAAFDILAIDDLIAFYEYDVGLVAARVGGGYRVLVREAALAGFDRMPAWAPDGSRLAFSRSRYDWPARVLHIANADGSGIESLGQEGTEPAWSPDGTMIAFVSERDGNREIYRMRADGSDVVRLTDAAAADEHPVWSPDGQTIAFTRRSAGSDRNSEIFLMSADGSGIRSLARRGSYPAWSPDGARIAFSAYGSDRLDVYVMDADGGNVTNLTATHGDVASYDPSWSPDGRRIAYSSSVVAPEDTPYSLYVMNADGSGRQLVHPRSLDITVNPLRACLEAAWMPN